jgi:hypothetical protein
VTSVEDSEHSGRPSTGKTDGVVEQVKELVLKNRKNTTHSVDDMFRILLGSVQSTANTCQFDPKFMPAPLHLPREWGAQGTVCEHVSKMFKRGMKESQDYFRRRLQVMKHVCSGLTQRTGDSSDSGKIIEHTCLVSNSAQLLG